MIRIRFGAAIALMASAVALSACGMFGGEAKKMVCPATFIAPDTDKEAVFRPGGTTINDVRYGVQLAHVESKCQRGDRGIVVDTKVQFRLVASDPSVRAGTFEYFVSIVDGQQNILTKQNYVVPFEFGPRFSNMTKQDEIIENLPLLDASNGGNYAVVVGLQLNSAQLQFNRAGSRPPSLSVPSSVSVPPRAQQGDLSAPRP